MKNVSIGIMQGRLSPPTDGKFQSFPKYSWKEEFFRAKRIGLSSIEWIFEFDQWDLNPIAHEMGIREINEIIKETGVVVESICADYFMDSPYLKSNNLTKKELKERLRWLVYQANKISVKYIDLPFVDASKITSRDDFNDVREFVRPALEIAQGLGIVITLETSLNPVDSRKLLSFLNHPSIMFNYDSGNSASLGYNCRTEMTAYGKWIATVHIKDRILDGGTVPLGEGNADFDTFFAELAKLKFKGTMILQAARSGEEVECATNNRNFILKYFEKHY